MEDNSSQARPTRGRRDPKQTREEILKVAGKLLAKDGPEGLSVSQVAQLAGVNRGTAYHHFPTREKLIEETKTWVSRRLCDEVFGDLVDAEFKADSVSLPSATRAVTERLITFSMENPEYGRVWLFELLSSSQPASDLFWNTFKSRMDLFLESDYAQPNVDGEVYGMLVLLGAFLWPVWSRARSQDEEGRKKMAQRFTDEILRLGLHGIMNREKFPELTAISDNPKADKSN